MQFTAMLAQALRDARTPPRRSLREFAEQDIVLPTGQHRDSLFAVARQPYAGQLFDALDSGQWTEHIITGPSQSGKTLSAHVIPVLHRIAEIRRNVVIAMPDMRMVNNKWATDFLPVLQASPRLRALLPSSGPGSKGGQIKDSIEFTNGVIVKFMTRGGDDTARAGFTAEGGVFVTELAGFSHAGQSSVEASPLKQITARLRGLRLRDRYLVAEGTETLADELPHQLYQESTRSELLAPCPLCGRWIAPERGDLVGWDQAASELEAAERAHFRCPACQRRLTETQRRAAVGACRLVHAGQAVDPRGRLVGDPPKTTRLWFRWSAWHNLLLEAADFAVDEWRCRRLPVNSAARDECERELTQFVWARPYVPPDLILEPGPQQPAEGAAAGQVCDLPRGELPDDTAQLAVFCDCGMYELHWAAICGRRSRAYHCADYGTLPVLRRGGPESAEQRQRELKSALTAALAELQRRVAIGWSCGGRRVLPDRVLIDAGWESDVIHSWARAAGAAFMPAIGRGSGQRAGHSYNHPNKKTNEIRGLGERYHVRRHATHRTLYVVHDSDHWKGAVHRALAIAPGLPGSLSLFLDQQTNHATLERHLLAEQLERTVHPRHGIIERWTNPKGSPNHYLDAVSGALVALHHAGFRLVDSPAPAAAPARGGWLSRRG